ncbi:MAG: protein kinase, partial [Pirellulales bacterium]|nr:protein kinase [Pirellulales bacterium]
GRGGMGFVFRAQDKKLQREVAMKVMNRKVAESPHSRTRFIREARAMAAVDHDNVVTIYEVGEKSGTPFMAMEMLQGVTLETANQDQLRLRYEKIIDYALQITRGLAAAHRQGIVHRDIKPANLWLESDKNRLKILDFGLALASSPVDQLAARGAVIGSPGYLSPEQARGEPLDDRTDLYSLGVVLYELCTGQLPFRADSIGAQLIAIIAHRAPAITKINSEIPAPLANLVHRLLLKEPRARIRSAVELETELERVTEECHAKSEVAQTISKLQAGLDKVVSQQSAPLETTEVLDPFAAIPDMPAAVAASPLGPAASMPPAKPIPARPEAAANQVSWQKYIPIAAIAAAVLVALPVMTFWFSSRGRNNQAFVVTQQPQADAEVNPTAQQKNSVTAAGVANPASNMPRNRQATTNNKNGSRQSTRVDSNKQASRQRSGNTQRGSNQGGRGNSAPAKSGQESSVAGFRPNGNETSSGNRPSVAPGQEVDRSENRLKVQAGRAVNRDAADTVRPAADAVPQQMVTSTISTGDGRGADTMVQIGSSRKQGLRPSIGIHRRGKIESHHSYLRFDLASLDGAQKRVSKAEVVLSIVGQNRATGATVRLYGVNRKLPLWQEEGPKALLWANTPSKQGLDSLPLLDTQVVSDEASGASRLLRFSSPALVEFLRQAPDETVTLVLAGDSKSDTPLRFVSREGDVNKAPKLVIEAPAGGPGNHRNRRFPR